MNPRKPHADKEIAPDEPIRLAPDDEDDDEQRYRFHPRKVESTIEPDQETVLDMSAQSASLNPPLTADSQLTSPAAAGSGAPISEALRWALDSLHQPAMAAADWLARDIDPTAASAADLLSNPSITLTQVRQAKAVFKTMRIVGEKSADRRVGARMYAASIAAGLVRHGKKISSQSDAALRRGFNSLLEDRRMPMALRDLAGMALCSMDNLGQQSGNGHGPAKMSQQQHQQPPRSKSA